MTTSKRLPIRTFARSDLLTCPQLVLRKLIMGTGKEPK